MTTGKDLSDWMSVSGGRRQACKRAPLVGGSGVRAISADVAPEATKPTAAPRKGLARGGPIDWVEFMRGSLFFGILGGVLWVEWVAIKSLAVLCSQFFGG